MTKREEFEAAAKQFILIKDGPYGTAIQRAKLAPDSSRWAMADTWEWPLTTP